MLLVKQYQSSGILPYIAVSGTESIDADANGLRTFPGGYETSKLFASTIEEAAQFRKNNFKFDCIPNTIMEVKVSNSVLNNATKFGAGGMNSISIPKNQLPLLQAKPINYSPFIK